MSSINDADIDVQRRWSDETFGPGARTEGVLKHIEKEIAEVRASGGRDLEEWIDLIVLAIDGATRQGFSGREVVRAYHEKMHKNFEREWPDWREFGQDEPIEHVRGLSDGRRSGTPISDTLQRAFDRRSRQ